MILISAQASLVIVFDALFKIKWATLLRIAHLVYRGAGGIRTLVQTWYKVSFPHAYLLLGCRNYNGSILIRCLFSSSISKAPEFSKSAYFSIVVITILLK